MRHTKLERRQLQIWIKNKTFNRENFLIWAEHLREKMKKKNCNWRTIRDHSLFVHIMFRKAIKNNSLAILSIIKIRKILTPCFCGLPSLLHSVNNTDSFLPELFERRRLKFFNDFVRFNILSSYRFDAQCYQNGTVCFDKYYKKMPADDCSTELFNSTCGEFKKEIESSKKFRINQMVKMIFCR